MPTKKPRRKTSLTWPSPLEKPPPVPHGLRGTTYASKYWKRITPELVKAKVITTLDLESLEALCLEWDSYKTLSEWCKKNPKQIVITYKSGHMAEHVNVRLRQQAFANCTKLWPKFGLTPEGMSRINKSTNAAPVQAGNPVSDFAAQKTG